MFPLPWNDHLSAVSQKSLRGGCGVHKMLGNGCVRDPGANRKEPGRGYGNRRLLGQMTGLIPDDPLGELPLCGSVCPARRLFNRECRILIRYASVPIPHGGSEPFVIRTWLDRSAIAPECAARSPSGFLPLRQSSVDLYYPSMRRCARILVVKPFGTGFDAGQPE
jgi:hypothetical protein